MEIIKKYLLHVIAIILGAFFIYKGINKHWITPCKVYSPESSIPLYYQQVITAFCHSGFFKMIGLFQVTSGVLLFIPRTRLIGALILLPIIFNIFFIHLFLDNRPEELVESGIPFTMTLIIILSNLKNLKNLLNE